MHVELLHSKYLHLRWLNVQDVNDTSLEWMQDEEVNRYMETRWDYWTLDSIHEYVRKHQYKNEEPFFAICLNKVDKHIGNLKIGPINFHHRHADVSLFIGCKTLWGLGYGTEAIGLAVQFGFRIANLNKLRAGVYAENKSSLNAFLKNGFEIEGVLKNHVALNGNYTDLLTLGLLRTGSRV